MRNESHSVPPRKLLLSGAGGLLPRLPPSGQHTRPVEMDQTARLFVAEATGAPPPDGVEIRYRQRLCRIGSVGDPVPVATSDQPRLAPRGVAAEISKADNIRPYRFRRLEVGSGDTGLPEIVKRSANVF